jgi:hypothetical protein
MQKRALCIAIFLVGASLILGACGAAGLPGTQAPNCQSAFNKNDPRCAGLFTPVATDTPTPIPATPTPAAVQPQEYTDLMVQIEGYGVQMAGFNPNATTPFSGTLTPDVFVQADVVDLSFSQFQVVSGTKPLIIILKMDDSAYEQSKSYNCKQAQASEIDKRITDGTLHDVFFPGSTDKYVYICGLPGNFVKGYSGWAVFVTFDPARRGPIVIRGCDSVDQCIDAPKPSSTPMSAPQSGTDVPTVIVTPTP